MCQVKIVKADDRELLRNRNTPLIGLAHHAYGGDVIGAHHRGWHGVPLQQFIERNHAAFHRVVALNQKVGIDAQAQVFHCPSEGGLSRHSGFKAERAGDKCDSFMMELGQMLYRLCDSVLIVDLDIADAWERGTNVHKDERYLAETQTVEKRFLHGRPSLKRKV